MIRDVFRYGIGVTQGTDQTACCVKDLMASEQIVTKLRIIVEVSCLISSKSYVL